MEIDQIIKHCSELMDKSVQYLQNELRGIRTGRASTALIDFVKVDYYGSPTELRELAAVSVPEPTQLMVKPFDPSCIAEIVKAIETADLGLNPMKEGPAIRINVPAPSAERRKQLVVQVKKMAEDARVAVRNERRDANKHIDQLVKDKTNHVSEDDGKGAKTEVEDHTKKHTSKIDEICKNKMTEVEKL